MGNDEVGGLIRTALNHGLSTIHTEGAPIVPFIVTVDDEEQERVRSFLSDDMDLSIRRARHAVHERPEAVKAWAVVYNGVVTMPGGPFDAVVADVAARDWTGPHRWVQRYLRRTDGIELVGKVLYAGPVAS
jgi:hypothetical protein